MDVTIITGTLCSLLFLAVVGQTDDLIGITPKSQKIGKDELADAVNNLGYKLLVAEMTQNNEDKNIVISPSGVSGLLAMALLGSVGKTYDELADILGFSQDVKVNRANHELFGILLSDLNDNETYSKTMYADAVFVDDESALREQYTSYLERVYQGQAIAVNFDDKDTVKTVINEWVSNKTQGKISNFLKEPLPRETEAALLSALYFSGQWKQPFSLEHTLRMPFKTPKEEITADLMLNLGNFRYIYSIEEDVHMLALPYNDSATTLYALKPRRPDKLSLPEVINRLNYTVINKLIDQMSSRSCVIRFPKMNLQYNSNLRDSLQSLGLRSIFTAGQANFALMIENKRSLNDTENELISRINEGIVLETRNLRQIIDALPNPGVHVDTIIHDVKITIDEYGTEAVAATGGFLSKSAELFYADSPFFMFIRNEKTKLVTFSAAIFDPTS